MRFLGLSRETVSHASSGIFLPEKIAFWMVLSICASPNGAQIGQLDKDCNSESNTDLLLFLDALTSLGLMLESQSLH